MRFERPSSFLAPAAPLRVAPELAFLRATLSLDILSAATASAERAKVCPLRALIADGVLSARAAYAALAEHLGVAFVTHWPAIAPLADPQVAFASGEIILDDGTRLLAPEGQALRGILRDGAVHPDRPVAITTPAHLTALVHYRAQAPIAYLASAALPDASPQLSARGTCGRAGGAALLVALLGSIIGLAVAPRIVGDLFGGLFLAAMSFRLLVSAAGAGSAAAKAPPLKDDELPVYSVLLALRQEADVLPELLDSLRALDYPRAKLEVLLLVEPEDFSLRAALAKAHLPPWLHVILGPTGGALRTKPRALNIGLAAARGEFLCVFDAEDRPARNQLRRAAARFRADVGLECLQARLTIRADSAILARLFAIEYAALFDVFNLGLAAGGLPIALGGTSNHFRTATLREIGGWDAWNVTEDADLGLRLARFGLRVDGLDSITEETAPHSLRVWMKQRRRWTKGWLQTFLVLARDMTEVAAQLGARKAASIALLLTNLVIGPLLAPIFCGHVLGTLAREGLPSPAGPLELAETTLAASVFAMGILSPLWCGYAGLRAIRRQHLATTLPLLLPYHVMISAAAWLGLLDLLRQPFHWHKTPHQPMRGREG